MDINKSLLLRAREWCIDFANVSFVVGTLDALPFKNPAFDNLVWLYYCPSPDLVDTPKG